MISTRKADGLSLSAYAHLWKRDGDDWLVPSLSQLPNRVYRVGAGRCTCPDFENRGGMCKHQWAVRFHLEAVLELAKSGPDAESVFKRELEDGSFWERFRD